MAAAVALTFDDAPGACTADLLGVLATHGARATFFALGCELERRPDLARRIVDEGHELGNHTFSHARLLDLSSAEVERELSATSALIETVTGIRPSLFRPPYGLGGLVAEPIARDLGMTTVLWSVNPKDWDGKDAAAIAASVLDGIEPEAVVVLHDGGDERRSTVEALELCLPAIRSRGLALVGLSELLERSRRARRLTVVRPRGRARRGISSLRRRTPFRRRSAES
jgi:peptidoglycan/xylan/chitin deacetylase (PgdA/CDA1 family)